MLDGKEAEFARVREVLFDRWKHHWQEAAHTLTLWAETYKTEEHDEFFETAHDRMTTIQNKITSFRSRGHSGHNRGWGRVIPTPRWEHGYRCHGYWTGTKLYGRVFIGPRGTWDGIYRWEMEGTKEHGECKTLRAAKCAVEQAYTKEH